MKNNKITRVPQISRFKNLSSLEASGNPLKDFDSFLNSIPKKKDYFYLNYSLDKSIEDQNEQIEEKLAKKISSHDYYENV